MPITTKPRARSSWLAKNRTASHACGAFPGYTVALFPNDTSGISFASTFIVMLRICDGFSLASSLLGGCYARSLHQGCPRRGRHSAGVARQFLHLLLISIGSIGCRSATNLAPRFAKRGGYDGQKSSESNGQILVFSARAGERQYHNR